MTSMYNVDEKLVKRPQDDSPLTEEEVDEWIKCANDKWYFFEKYVMIQGEFGRTHFAPREYQKRIITTAEASRFTVNLCGRQAGKTTVLGMDILHDITFKRDYNVGISSYKNDNVYDFILRIQFAYEALPWFLKNPCTVYNKTNIRFSNGSSVYAAVTSPTFGRGKSLQRIILDELAFVDNKISESLISSLLPSISGSGEQSKTRLNVISTPNGTQGAFFKIWANAVAKNNAFAPVEVKYEEIPGRTAKFEKDMIAEIGRDQFDQEFRNMFISSSGTLVNSRKIEAIEYSEPVRSFGDLEIFVNSLRGRTLALACDIAEGIGEDYSVIQVFDINTFEQVGEYANNMVNQTNFVNHIMNIIKMFYNEGVVDIYWTFESNSIGAGIARLVENINDPTFQRAMLLSDMNPHGRLGMYTSSVTKKNGCGVFKDLVEMDKMKLNSVKLINELKTFIKKGSSFAAQNGNHDDRVMACILMVNLFGQLKNYEDSVERTVNELQYSEDEEFWGIDF